MMLYNDDDNGDLMSIVRSCSRMKKKETITPRVLSSSASDPFSYIHHPPPFTKRTEERLLENFSSPFSMNQAMFRGFEDIAMPLYPQSQSQQHQTTNFPLLPSSVDACPATMTITDPPQKQPQSQHAVAGYRERKDEKTKVTMENNSNVSNENWAWRKYGEKPIKDSHYRRSYYKCSTCKTCPARKMVDKSQIEPKTLIITYSAEHNHPPPTHYNSAAATTLKKYSYSSPSSGRREVQDGETLFDNSTEDTGGHENCP